MASGTMCQLRPFGKICQGLAYFYTNDCHPEHGRYIGTAKAVSRAAEDCREALASGIAHFPTLAILNAPQYKVQTPALLKDLGFSGPIFRTTNYGRGMLYLYYLPPRDRNGPRTLRRGQHWEKALGCYSRLEANYGGVFSCCGSSLLYLPGDCEESVALSDIQRFLSPITILEVAKERVALVKSWSWDTLEKAGIGTFRVLFEDSHGNLVVLLSRKDSEPDGLW